MASRITQAADRTPECGGGLCNRVHGAGIRPNIMNRFMHPNTHEVLFVI
jgi:hypothetical protein